MPADSTRQAEVSGRSLIMFLNKAKAMGERQIFPVQTKRTEPIEILFPDVRR